MPAPGPYLIALRKGVCLTNASLPFASKLIALIANDLPEYFGPS
ncbi:hypothetical protein [Pseudomonas sp. NPDC089401]